MNKLYTLMSFIIALTLFVFCIGLFMFITGAVVAGAISIWEFIF